MLKISHRVGHALTTKGKQSPDGVKEWAQAAPIAKLVIGELAHYENVGQQRFDDPTGRIDKTTKQLCSEVNGWGSEVHIDYHLNAHGDGGEWTSGNGVEVFVNTRKPKEAVELAQKVQSNIVKVTGFRDRGVKFHDWDMVNYPKGTNILIEMGFMTNKDDVSIIRSTDGQIKIAAAIVDAIVSQYKLKRRVTYSKIEKEELSVRIKKGDKGEMVKLIHFFLASLGYTQVKHADIDEYQDFTVDAVKRFQQDQILTKPTPGEVDFETFSAFAKVLHVYYKDHIQK